MHEITIGCRKLVGFLLQASGRPADFDSESSSPTRTNLSALRTDSNRPVKAISAMHLWRRFTQKNRQSRSAR
jgi:hypothetical protein